VGAIAYTVGRDIAFGVAQYALNTSMGRRLLAHELTHVVQQSVPTSTDVLQLDNPHSAQERVAEHTSERVLSGHRGSGEWIKQGHRTLARQKSPGPQADDIGRKMARNDWHGAAQMLAQLSQETIEARVNAMSSRTRQYLVEGARHGEGHWNIDAIIAVVDRISHRDAVIGSVRFFVWKHLWRQAGTYLCGLDHLDIRRVATQLHLTFDDMHAIADVQPGKEQQTYLNVAFFSQLQFVEAIPKGLVAKDADKLLLGWLAADEVVAPYAAAKWTKGRKPKVTVVPNDKWADVYGQHSINRTDPETGEKMTADKARQRSVQAYGFTTEADEIFIRDIEMKPGTLLHEAVHALAPSGWEDSFGRAAEEGAAEYFARRVAHSAGKHPPRAYPEQHEAVAAVAGIVGDAALADAYFTGKTLKLELAVDDARGEGKMTLWRRALEDPKERKNAAHVLQRSAQP